MTSLAALEDAPDGIGGVAHRVVHGGRDLREPVVIDDGVERRLAAATELAPLHNTPALEAIREARAQLPDIPHVAVFDSAFHETIPEEAATYALPARVRDEWGIRRFGFHGLSVQWASEQVRVTRLVVCHLGGGCSVTAVRDGRSVDTTMGFTPLEGVPMATRAGSVDPGALLYLLRHHLTLDELDRMLEHESGLAGLSGLSGDVEELEQSEQPAAALALNVFAYRVATAVGALAVALGGLDALVFTAGIGEHSPRVRAAVCARLGFLGVELDDSANEGAEPDATISPEGASPRVLVLRAREDLVAARAARELLSS
jgi:acetate kinase